jgi:hypothetical protein
MPDIPAREVADNCVACRVLRDGTAYGWRNHAHGLGRDIWSDHFAADGQARGPNSTPSTRYPELCALRPQPCGRPARRLAALATTPCGTLCRRANRWGSSLRSTRRSSASSPSPSVSAREICFSCTASTTTPPAIGRRATAVTRPARCATSTCSRTCGCRPAGPTEAPSWQRWSLAPPASGDAKTRGSGTEVWLWAAPARPRGRESARKRPPGHQKAPTLPLPTTSRQMRCDLGGRRRNHTCVDSPHVVVDGRGTAQPRHPVGRQIM